MISSSQIRERIAQFLGGLIDLDTFEDWIIASTWNVHRGQSRAAEELTFAVEESLSEYSSGHIDEHALRNELSEILQRENRIVTVGDVPDLKPTWGSLTSAQVVSVSVQL